MYVAGHHHAFFTTTPGGSGTPTYSYIGSTKNGYRLQYRQHKQNVINDAFGDGAADAIQQGADCQLRLEWIEYDLISSVLGVQTGSFGNANVNVGKTLSSLSGALFLYPVQGTPWATTVGVGKGKLFYLASPDEEIEVLLGSKLAEGPLTFNCLPYLVSNVYRFFNDVVSPTLPSYSDYPL